MKQNMNNMNTRKLQFCGWSKLDILKQIVERRPPMTSPSHKPSRAEKRTMRSDILSVVNMLSYRLNLRLLFLWSIQNWSIRAGCGKPAT